MSRAAFIVAFEGPSVEDGSIDVRDLAPALLALGQAVDAANRVVNGDRVPARVQAKATSKGSFEVSLEVVLTGWEAVRGFLLSDDVDGAKQLLEWIGILGGPTTVGASVIALYRFLKGRRPDHVERSGGLISVTIDGQTLTISEDVLRVSRDAAFNQSLGKLMATLENDRIESIQFRNGPSAPAQETLTQADRAAFALPAAPDETVTDQVRRLALSIRALTFQEGNKWRLFDGQNVITAVIEDADFLGRVARNELRFAKDDVLLCEVRTIQRQGAEGLKTEHVVLRVLDHKPAPTQIVLF